MYASEYIETFVPGALRAYDLPHLVGALAPRRVLLHNPVDGAGQILSEPAAAAEYAAAASAYHNGGALAQLEVRHGGDARATLGMFLRE